MHECNRVVGIYWPGAQTRNTDVGWMKGEAEAERWHNVKGEAKRVELRKRKGQTIKSGNCLLGKGSVKSTRKPRKKPGGMCNLYSRTFQ